MRCLLPHSVLTWPRGQQDAPVASFREGAWDDNKENPYVFPLKPISHPPTHTYTYTPPPPLQKNNAPVKTHHTSARFAEACLQLSAHHAGIPGRLCPAERLMLPRNIWQRTGRLWKSECKLACQVWREEREDSGGGGRGGRQGKCH